MRSIYSMHEKRPKAQPGLSFSWRDAQKLRRRGCFGKKIRGSSFNYKTLERDSITDSIGIFWGKDLFFYSYVDDADLGDISKSFEIVQPFSCLEGLCHQYENLNLQPPDGLLKSLEPLGTHNAVVVPSKIEPT